MSSQCIPTPELAEFVLGKLGHQRSESIASHIDDCLSCQDTIVALAEQSDTFVAGMQAAHAAGDESFQNENALQAGLRRVASSIRQTSESVLRASLPREEPTQIHEIGPYELISRLGIGGMGAVYKARHNKLKREVALKLLPRDRWPNTDVVTRFEREMEAIGQLDHPNIVRASDAGEEQGMHYLVMEYVDGLDLSRLVRRVGRFSAADACELIYQAAIGLQYAHDNRLIHRDIKPSNLILGWQQSSGVSIGAKPTLKILDLGLALLGEEHLHNEHDLTTVGQLMGTLDYMSPEQGLDSHDVDSRTDIFSLGATLFKLLTGKAPLEAISVTTPLKKLTSLATKQLPSIGTIREDLPEDLVMVIDKMLARDPDERYANAREVAEALQPFCAKANLATLLRRGLAADENEPAVGVGTALSRLPQTESRPSRTRPPFRRWVAYGLAAVAIALGAFVIYLETDKGQIRIEAKVADVEVEVRQGDRVVDTIEVAHVGSSQSTRIRSGTYEIVLQNAGDDVRISHDRVTISRAEKIPTVTVERIDRSSTQAIGSQFGSLEQGDNAADRALGLATKSDKITYDGRTFSEWLAELKVERKAERMLDAVKALRRLHDDDQAEAAIRQMLSSMRVYGSLFVDDSPEGQLVKAVRESLNDMQSDQVYNAILREIQHGNANSREFLCWFFGASTQGYDSPITEYIGQHPDPLGEALIEVARSELPSTRAWAVETLTNLCSMAPDFASDNTEVLDLLRQAAKANDLNGLGFGAIPLTLTALEVLADHDPDREVVDLLIQQTKDNAPYHRLWAIQALQKVGPDAAPAIPQLIRLLRAEFDADYPFMQQTLGRGGMGGGTYGGGFGGPFTSPIYQATSPDVRTEIVKSLVTMGDRAVPAVPDLLKIMEEETRIDVHSMGGMRGGGGFGFGGRMGLVIRMTYSAELKGGPSEQAASDFMLKCFTVIKNCAAKEAIPLLTKYVSGAEFLKHGDYTDAPWISAAEETLNSLDPSAVRKGHSVPGELDEYLEIPDEIDEEDQESKPSSIEPDDGLPARGGGDIETPSIELDGSTSL